MTYIDHPAITVAAVANAAGQSMAKKFLL